MKKEVLLLVFLLLLIVPFINAAEDNESESYKVNLARDCLNEKVEDNCDSLTLEEQIFSLLSIGECEDEIIDDLSDSNCWPKENCNVKATAQAILSLERSGENTDDAQDWLLEQKQIPEELIWFLQIESTEPTTCTISYSGSSHTISIGEDKKINSNAGACLSLAQDNYWLKISRQCYDEEFLISCNQGFLTTLLFKKTDSSTVHVSAKTNSAASGGETSETVNSSCFADGNDCNYEGSLWAALVLDYLDEDIGEFLPYLETMAEDNDKYLPESFLYLLTNLDEPYRNDLILLQSGGTNGGYWEESGDKYYDTAVAFLSLKNQEFDGKEKAKEWLLDAQDSDGCWQGSVRNTGFLLYSIWGSSYGSTAGTTEPDCEDSGYFCTSSNDCDNILNGYDGCAGIYVCCQDEPPVGTCAEQNGEICLSEETCVGGVTVSADDVVYGQDCCVGGTCQIQGDSTENECEDNGGICTYRNDCGEGYEETSMYSCEYESDKCCMEKESSNKGGSSILIWILVILIVLVIVGFIFKDQLRVFWFRIKSKFSEGGSSPNKPADFGPRFPPSAPNYGSPSRPPIQRKILPPSQPRPAMRNPMQKKPSEMDDVLKKLKEMGK